jgi:malate permease and related proteins
VLIFLSGLIAWPFAKFSGTTVASIFAVCHVHQRWPDWHPLDCLAYGPEGMATAVVLLVISNFCISRLALA